MVSVFRGTRDIIPFVQRFVGLEERQVYQGTRLLPEYPVIPFPVDLESVARAALWSTDRTRTDGDPRSANASARGEPQGVPRVFGGADLRRSSAFEGFNLKFWGRRLEDMPAEWGKLRHLERVSENGLFRLPSRAPHYDPSGGFNPLFERMLAGFDVRTRTRVASVRPAGRRIEVFTDAGAISADLVIATAPIDAMLEYRFGPLEWRGYRIETDVVEDDAGPVLGTAPDDVPFALSLLPAGHAGLPNDGFRRDPPRVKPERARGDPQGDRR